MSPKRGKNTKRRINMKIEGIIEIKFILSALLLKLGLIYFFILKYVRVKYTALPKR